MGKKSFRVRPNVPKTRQLRFTDIDGYREKVKEAAAVAEAVREMEAAGEIILPSPRRTRSSSASTIPFFSCPRKRRMPTGRH
jgi:hypothetical protein